MTTATLTIAVRGTLGPVADAAVVLKGDAHQYHARTDRDGVATLNVPHGQYELRVAAKGHADYAKPLTVVGDAAVDVDLGRGLLPIVGSPDPRGRDEWLLLALLTLADVDSAVAFWRQHAPARFAGLLGGDRYAWNPRTQTYASPNGSRLTSHDLYNVGQSVIRSAEHDAEDAAARMARGETDLATWQNGLAQAIRDLYLSVGVLAVGGAANVTDDHLASVVGDADAAPSLAFSVGRLFDFARAVADADARADTERAVVDRSGAYLESAHGIGERLRRQSHDEATDDKGRRLFLYERSLLMEGSVDHCRDGEHTEGCVEAAAAGWQPIGTLAMPGTRTCLYNCKCMMLYSLTGPAEEN